MHAHRCVFSSLALPSERPGDIPIVIGIPTSQVFDSKYNYPVKETGFLGEMSDSRVKGWGEAQGRSRTPY